MKPAGRPWGPSHRRLPRGPGRLIPAPNLVVTQGQGGATGAPAGPVGQAAEAAQAALGCGRSPRLSACPERARSPARGTGTAAGGFPVRHPRRPGHPGQTPLRRAPPAGPCGGAAAGRPEVRGGGIRFPLRRWGRSSGHLAASGHAVGGWCVRCRAAAAAGCAVPGRDGSHDRLSVAGATVGTSSREEGEPSCPPARTTSTTSLVLDASSSMSHLSRKVVEVADQQIAYLARRSRELDQETRVTVYVSRTRWSASSTTRTCCACRR